MEDVMTPLMPQGKPIPMLLVLLQEVVDTIGEAYVRDFQPEVLGNPAPVDIEGFIECYLGMTMDYQHLSHNGIYLGMTRRTHSPSP